MLTKEGLELNKLITFKAMNKGLSLGLGKSFNSPLQNCIL